MTKRKESRMAPIFDLSNWVPLTKLEIAIGKMSSGETVKCSVLELNIYYEPFFLLIESLTM
jgi:hypothetical protein